MEATLHLPEPQDVTRDRILHAAGEIFATEGFHNATIRAICEKAQVNVAAVNYHFRDKLGLYTEVLRESVVHDKLIPPIDIADPREALRVFISQTISRLLKPGYESWRMHIMARELAQPTPALKEVIEQTIRPKSEWLRDLISQITGLSVDDTRVRRAAFSVVGQCMMYRIGAPVLRELWPEMRACAEQAEQIAAHITAFSLHGIEGLASQPNPWQPNPKMRENQ